MHASQWYDIEFLKIHDRLHLSKALTWPSVLIGWKSVKKILRVLSGSGEKVTIGSNPLGNWLAPSFCSIMFTFIRFQGFPFANVFTHSHIVDCSSRYKHLGQFAPLGGEQTAAQLPGDWVSIGHSSQWLWYSVYARYCVPFTNFYIHWILGHYFKNLV